MSLEYELKAARNFNVTVMATDHANLDSLPLRYGLHFSHDTQLELQELKFLYSDYQYSDRFHVEANFRGNNGQTVNGHFVLGSKRGTLKPVVITVWSGDVKTEMRLSEVMIALRQRGVLTPKILLSLHPLYLDGRLSTSADLVEQLAKLLSAEKLAVMNAELKDATIKAEQALAAMELATSRAEKAEKIALEASYVVDDLEAKNGSLTTQIDVLETEIQQYRAEQKEAALEKSEATLSSPDVLIEVKEGQMYRGSSCTILVFADGSHRHMKTSTFDRTGAVTKKAASLLGRRVRTSCWDPIGQPGKWSSQGYFRNVYAVE
jgi:hypothetical protein